jgi:hypothetical protein
MHSLLSLCLIAALIRAANLLHVRGDLSIDLDSKCILLSANSSQLRPMTGHTPPPILLSLSQEQTERFASLIENLSGLAYSTLCQQSGSISTDSQFSGYVQSDSCRRRHSVLLAGADEVELSSPIKNRPRSLQPTEACLQNSGESSPCEDGFERAIILLENPFEALWRSLRKSNVKFQRREDVAFLNAEATKRAQQAVIQTAESLSKSWYDHINIILQGLRPEQLYLIKIESILNAVIARRMDLFENLLHFIDSTIQVIPASFCTL